MELSLTQKVKQEYLENNLIYNIAKKYKNIGIEQINNLKKYLEKLFMIITPHYYTNKLIAFLPISREFASLLSEHITQHIITRFYEKTYTKIITNEESWKFLMCVCSEAQKLLLRYYLNDIIVQIGSRIDKEINLPLLYGIFCREFDPIVENILERGYSLASSFIKELDIKKVLGDVLEYFELYARRNLVQAVDYLPYFIKWFIENGSYLFYVSYQLKPNAKWSPLAYKNFVRSVLTCKGYNYAISILKYIFGSYLKAVHGLPYRFILYKLGLGSSFYSLEVWTNRIKYIV